MKCKQCGKDLLKDWDVCHFCQTPNQYKNRRDKKIKIIIGIIILLAICILLVFFISSKNYWSTETKSDDEILSYIQYYMNKKYNTNITLTLQSKEPIEFCEMSFLGSCLSSIHNDNIYRYTYTATDSQGNTFTIVYTNPYFGKLHFHKSEIDDEYYIINNESKIEQIVTENYPTNKIYHSIENQCYHILIFDKDMNYKKLETLFTNLSDDYAKYTLLIINNFEDYQKILTNNYQYKNDWGWDNRVLEDLVGYKSAKNIDIKDNQLPKINIARKTAIVFMADTGLKWSINSMWIFDKY